MYKILIVEDDEVIAKTLKVHLEKWGYQARCAEDFKQVAKEFKEYAPHLVLMDIGLPFYDTFMIIEKTQGRMAEDDFWIRIEK